VLASALIELEFRSSVEFFFFFFVVVVLLVFDEMGMVGFRAETERRERLGSG